MERISFALDWGLSAMTQMKRIGVMAYEETAVDEVGRYAI